MVDHGLRSRARHLERSEAGRGRTAAGAVYVLYALAFFTAGLSAVAGVVMAQFARGGADDWVRSHFARQTRLAGAWFLFAILGGLRRLLNGRAARD